MKTCGHMFVCTVYQTPEDILRFVFSVFRINLSSINQHEGSLFSTIHYHLNLLLELSKIIKVTKASIEQKSFWAKTLKRENKVFQHIPLALFLLMRKHWHCWMHGQLRCSTRLWAKRHLLYWLYIYADIYTWHKENKCIS